MTEPDGQRADGWAPPSYPAAPTPPASPGYVRHQNSVEGWSGYPARPAAAYPPGAPGQPWYPGAAAAPMMAVLPGGHPLPPTARVDPVPGTPFGVAFLRVPRIPSGAAIGGLVAGIASVLISFVTGCFGVAVGQGVLIGGAFAILAVALGGGGIGLGLVGLRQTRRDPGQVTGRGMAIAGMSCGGGGVLLTVLAMIGAAAIAAAG